MPSLIVRNATRLDIPSLRRLEHAHFTDVAAASRGGFMFDRERFATPAVDDAFAGPRRMFVSVAELDNEVVGFAYAQPFSLPGAGEIDPRNMLLQFLAVDSGSRRQGIGRQLVDHIESRVLRYRQDVMVAHVPADEADFYRRSGWEVLAATAGFAWLPFNDFLRADVPDPAIGFEFLAARVLRPRAIRKSFGFPSLTGRPTADAIAILEELVARGDIDQRDLDEGTLTMMSMARFTRGRPSGTA